jgi:hypothetical protein
MRLPVCAKKTASAIVKLEQISTAVLIVPKTISKLLLPTTKASG